MFFVLLILFVILAVYFFNSNFKTWEKLGVPGPKPHFFFGNVKDIFLMKRSLPGQYDFLYRCVLLL